MPDDKRARETLPPSDLELAHVEAFERAAREDENAARLAELERLRYVWSWRDD